MNIVETPPAPSFRCAVIVNGSVVNVIMADPVTDEIKGAVVIASDSANIGDSYDGKQIIPAPAPAPILSEPSLRDVLIKKGIVTVADFTPVSAVTLPGAVATVDKSA